MVSASPSASGESTAHGSKGTLSQTHRGAPDTRIRVPHHRTSHREKKKKKSTANRTHATCGGGAEAREIPAPSVPGTRCAGPAAGTRSRPRTFGTSSRIFFTSRAYISPFPGAVRPFSFVARCWFVGSNMSCNGCRVLRKGCSDACVLRPCLQWIDTAEAQGHATVFVAKFFGRAGLLSFITAVPEDQRPALFRSLLYEAAGRTINPVNGAVGLLGTGDCHRCQAAVETVLRGGAIGPLPEPELGGGTGDLYGPAKRTGGWSTFSTAMRVPTEASCDLGLCLNPGTPSMSSDDSITTTGGGDKDEPLLLDLFV